MARAGFFEALLQDLRYGVRLLRLNPASWEVMRKERTSVQLLQPVRRKKGEKVKASKADTASWEGVDKGSMR